MMKNSFTNFFDTTYRYLYKSNWFAPTIVFLMLILTWSLASGIGLVAPYILPPPWKISEAFFSQFWHFAPDAQITCLETIGGLILGISFGIVMALLMSFSPLFGRAIAPFFVIAQALPVFAIAPAMVVWFGFGFTPKLILSALILFFPVTVGFYEGLKRTDANLIDLARLHRASPWQTLWLLRTPAALPALAAGIEIAAALAPIGAVIGEWVGSARGLGLLMVQANARSKTDLMFAEMLVLVMQSLVLWSLARLLTYKMLRFAPDNR